MANGMPPNLKVEFFKGKIDRGVSIMELPVVEFSKEGYKIRKVFG